MYFADIEVGKIYGVRDGRASLRDRPVHKVKVLAKLDDKKRSKVQYLEGEREGLEEFLPSKQFLARWTEVKRVLRDEERLERLRLASLEGFNPVVWKAVSLVIEATGEEAIWTTWGSHGVHCLQVTSSELSRIQERFGLEPLESLHPLGFTDRQGTLNLPVQAAETIAMHIASKEPQAVLLCIQQEEEELLAAGYQPGMRHRHEMLREHQPAFALARQWAGLKGEAELLTREIDRLRTILVQTIWTLKRNGADNEARRLERALEGR